MNISVNNFVVDFPQEQPISQPGNLTVNGENLFAQPVVTVVSESAPEEKDMLEAQLAEYEAELASLEAEKAQKEAEKKELEAQKKVLVAQKEKLQAEIENNNQIIEQYASQVSTYNEELQAEQAEIEDLQKQYDAKNKEAQELTEQVSEKIAKLLEDSNNNVKEQRAKIQQATEEAYAKVASGELDESEVAQYVAQKAGSAVTFDSSSAFSEINSLSAQIKSLITSASTIMNKISSKQTNANKLQAQVESGNSSINELKAANQTKKQELSSVNDQISTINTEIKSVNSEIQKIDVKIEKVNTNIATTKASISSLNGSYNEGNVANESGAVDVVFDQNETTEDKTANQTTVNTSAKNPFEAVSFVKADYSNILDALDAIVRNNDTAVQAARTQDNNNKQEIRKMFQDILK